MPVEQMQVTITKPIEDAVNSVPGLMTVRSTTSRGSAEISLFFDWNQDMFRSLQLVDAALSKVEQTLPATAKITTNRLTFATFPILGYSLTSDTVPQTRLWEIATYDLKPPLNRVEGVSTVTVQGGQVPEFHVVPNPALLQLSGVTIPDLVNAIQASNIVDSPGLYEANHELILGLVGAQVHDAEQLRQLVVKTTPAGTPVACGRCGHGGAGHDACIHHGDRERQRGGAAEYRPPALQQYGRRGRCGGRAGGGTARKLPAGVKLELFYDQSQMVRDCISSVRDAIFIGLILACIILFLFLRDWTSSLIAGLVIPVTLAVTVLVLWAIGQSFNLMTLGGLAAAIGLVIDDAIVVVENIVMHRDAGETRGEAVRKALKEITTPLIGSTITPVVVFLPLVSVSGVTGSFFRALAITMTAALLTSLMLALTWTPSLSIMLLKDRETEVEREEHQPRNVLTQVLQFHKRALDWALAKPLWVSAACLLLVVATWAGYQALGSDLLPQMDEGGFILDYIMPAGSSLSETNRVLDHVERILARDTRSRNHISPDRPANGPGRRDRGQHRRLHREAEGEAQPLGLGCDGGCAPAGENDRTGAGHRADPGLAGQHQRPLQCARADPDQAFLRRSGSCCATRAQGRRRHREDSRRSRCRKRHRQHHQRPGHQLSGRSRVAARLGFTPAEVSEDATSILDGIATTDPLIANGRPYTIRVRLGDETRASLDAIENTVFNSASGHTASLGSLAEVQQLPPQNEIRRENLQRLVVVTGDLEGSDLGTAMAKVQQTVAGLHLPAIGARGVRRHLRGAAEILPRSAAGAAAGAGAGLRRAARRVPQLPRAHRHSHLVGALHLRRHSGAARHAAPRSTSRRSWDSSWSSASWPRTAFCCSTPTRSSAPRAHPPREAMLHAAQRRLRPIVMTALAAVCGMLPLAFALGAGSQMLQPLAIAVIGGLTISMVLSLVVTPLVYFLLTRHRGAQAGWCLKCALVENN